MDYKKMFRVTLVLAVTTLVTINAQRCAKTKNPVNQFEINRFVGAWYVVYSVNTTRQDCGEVNYTKTHEVDLRADTKFKQLVQHSDTSESMILQQDDTAHFGHFYEVKGADYVDYIILDTDYTNWAIVYTCQSIKSLPRESSMLLGRKPSFDKKTKQRIEDSLVNHGLSFNHYTPLEQSNKACGDNRNSGFSILNNNHFYIVYFCVIMLYTIIYDKF